MASRLRAFVVLGLVCLTFGLRAGEPTPVPAWKPDAAVATELSTPVAVAGFSIQPPKGYKDAPPKTGLSGTQTFVWFSNPRQDGSRAYLMATVMSLPPEEAGAETPEQIQAKILAGIQKRRTGWSNTPPEKGTIDGQTFARTHWQATDSASDKVMKGFSYVTRLGDTFIQFSSQDVAHGGEKCLAIAEASVLTFRAPKSAPPPAAK